VRPTCSPHPAWSATDGNQDALPTVLLEALGAGLPMVTTPVAGIPEIVDHDEHGLVVDCGDAVAVAAGIVELFDDDERWAAMSAAGRCASPSASTAPTPS
jgi:colanic acid/amylovoran biosynthesis glycosyltransferase